MKTCSTCGEAKDLSLFSLDRSRKDGLQSKCKACDKACFKARCAEPGYAAKKKAYARERHLREKERINEQKREYKRANPEHSKAQRAVNLAVKHGAIVHVTACDCHDCGKPATEYHHESYKPEHWLHVVPLCRSCHRARHSPLATPTHETLHFVLRPTHAVSATDAS